MKLVMGAITASSKNTSHWVSASHYAGEAVGNARSALLLWPDAC
ncbi:hypothetical protein [endosymbiont of Lamellibrachia barhami]|nr:hypothetical protein [endosymbiont of Lamellibrachia barhami]